MDRCVCLQMNAKRYEGCYDSRKVFAVVVVVVAVVLVVVAAAAVA